MSDNELDIRDDPALYRQWTKVKKKLHAAKKHLVVFGSVRERRLSSVQSVWVVRYTDRTEGKTRRRSIYLGDEAIAECARELIERWRREQITPEERRHQQTLKLLDVSALALGFSRPARKRLQVAAEAARDDPRTMLSIVRSHPDPAVAFGQRGGRPSKSGLW